MMKLPKWALTSIVLLCSLSASGANVFFFRSAAGTNYMALSAPSSLSTYRSRMTEGMDRLALYFFPGGDSANIYSYARQNSTPYVIGEHIYVGNKGYVATATGTTAASAPSFVNTTKRSKTSTTGGSTTTDGTVTWEYYTDVLIDWGTAVTGFTPGQTTDWSDSNDGTHRVYRINWGGAPLGYYDPGAVAWRIHDYRSSRGLSTPDELKKWQIYAGYWLDNYVGVRHGGSWTGGSVENGYTMFPEGFYLDYTHATGRYKNGPTVTLQNLKDFAQVMSPWGRTSGPFFSSTQTVTKEGENREVAYAANALIQVLKAGGTINNWTIDGVTDSPFRWLIPTMLQHMDRWQNGVIDSGQPQDSFRSFMFGITAWSLIEWVREERANGRDPDRYTSHANIGTTPYYTFNWRTNATHGIARAWPTIATAIEDFAEWMRNTATTTPAAGSIKLWQVAYASCNSKDTLLYAIGNDSSGTITTPDPATDNQNLVLPVYAWIARERFQNGGSVTSRTPAQFMADADALADGAWSSCNVYDPLRSGVNYFYGKQFNQTMKYWFSYIDDRNAVSGRSD